MPYELGALIDSTRTITVHSAKPHDDAPARAALSAVALRHIVARDPSRSNAFCVTSIALQHVRYAGLLQVHDVVEIERRPVAIAPLPAGAPLSRLLLVPRRRGRRFGVGPAMRVVLDVARAVQVLHAARPELRPLGYVCADTVWVTTDARAILLPSVHCAPVKAGAAKAPWARYRAPEFDTGAIADDSADVYSLGVLLWELLAAGRPHSREPSARPWIGPEVVRLVMRARSQDIPTRPRDPGAFAAELATALSRIGERSRETGSGSRAAMDDEEKTVPGFVPMDGLVIGDEEKTVPGFAPSCMSDEGEGDDAATIELPLRAKPPHARFPTSPARVGFAVLPPPVRAANEPATHGPSRLTVPRPAVPRPPSPRLKVVTSTQSPATGELRLTNEPRRWVVGRAASAHLVVADPDMSREHFAVMWEGEGRYRVRDLGSKNGLFVNGRAATDSQLTPGDEVRAGGTRLRFEA